MRNGSRRSVSPRSVSPPPPLEFFSETDAQYVHANPNRKRRDKFLEVTTPSSDLVPSRSAWHWMQGVFDAYGNHPGRLAETNCFVFELLLLLI